MSKLISYCFVLLMVISCQSIEKAPLPDPLIDENQMVEILTDIAFIRAGKTSNKKILENESINPEAYILRKHGIDSAVFAQNNAWYSDNLDTYSTIFKRVKINLNKEKRVYERLKKREDSVKKIKDSIKKVEDSIKKALDTLSDKEKLIRESLREKDSLKLKRIKDSLALKEITQDHKLKSRKDLITGKNKKEEKEKKKEEN
ncbi:DUF4296 domain-containing protein [Aquimarina pacifica]|uniref:DUF4296 domain-containing protein n=1 Tax=Aquimarina pacifica TaxID=1296415 RepID=UPI0005539320|nr:DUF4296 domain-containing protein [Aquimarina pacifica]